MVKPQPTVEPGRPDRPPGGMSIRMGPAERDTAAPRPSSSVERTGRTRPPLIFTVLYPFIVAHHRSGSRSTVGRHRHFHGEFRSIVASREVDDHIAHYALRGRDVAERHRESAWRKSGSTYRPAGLREGYVGDLRGVRRTDAGVVGLNLPIAASRGARLGDEAGRQPGSRTMHGVDVSRNTREGIGERVRVGRNGAVFIEYRDRLAGRQALH